MRDAVLRTALAQTNWRDCIREPLAGDASARRYSRLMRNGVSVAILMDDPPSATQATERFALIADALGSVGLAAPQIWLHDKALGIMVIEDLGATDFAVHLRHAPQEETTLYEAGTDLLGYLHGCHFTLPLTTITADVAAEMISLAARHYAPTPVAERQLHDAMRDAFGSVVKPNTHLALRDFHAENLIWRPHKAALDRVGLLDFQDACYAPAGYDLMSLLRDARRDVDPRVADQMIARFCATIGEPVSAMSAHLACVSAQRNLRILGIFARLASDMGKTKYLTLLPRVWGHLMHDLGHPALCDLKTVVLDALPPPDAATIKRLGAP